MKKETLRINLILGIVSLATLVIAYNLFNLAYLKHSSYSLKAQAQNENIANIIARGNIYIQNPSSVENSQERFLVATNKKFALAQVFPNQLGSQNKEELATKLSTILNVDRAKVLTSISGTGTSAKALARRLDNEQVEAIKALGIKGISIAYETDRYYPADSLAADVLGFLGHDETGRSGQYGIEAAFNSQLFGRVAKSDTLSSVLSPMDSIKSWFGKDKEDTTSRPSDVVLTIDRNIQSYAESQLEALLKQWSAEGGSIIVQDPQTGKILAMADKPTFNPNKYGESAPRSFLNRNVQEMFEPGSSFKPLTMAMGLDDNKITPDTTYTDVGFVNIGGYEIRNFSDRVFGLQTMTQVLQNSVNTGVMYVTERVGQDKFLDYTINMGFGQTTGIDLPGEVNGNIGNLYAGRKINFLTASFGQGIAVTPIQMVNAYSMIANGGKLMKPYIVDRIISEGGKEEVTEPEIMSIPISEKTAARVSSMLVSVVDNGFDKARITGYDVAGKTGTAQIPDDTGGYSKDQYIHDFVGFVPASNPRFTIFIKIDKPQGIAFASDSLSPTFKRISEFLIRYYNIPPTR